MVLKTQLENSCRIQKGFLGFLRGISHPLQQNGGALQHPTYPLRKCSLVPFLHIPPPFLDSDGLQKPFGPMQDFQRRPFLLEGNGPMFRQFPVFLSSLALMFAAERVDVGSVEPGKINLPQYQGN